MDSLLSPLHMYQITILLVCTIIGHNLDLHNINLAVYNFGVSFIIVTQRTKPSSMMSFLSITMLCKIQHGLISECIF